MKMKSEAGQLLDEVLAEDLPADFRSRLLEGTLRQARRQKQFNRWNRGILAAVLLAACLLWAQKQKPRAPVEARKEPAPELLKIIVSRPLAPGMIVNSAPGFIREINSANRLPAYIATDSSRHTFQEVTDEQLLAFAAGKPAVLVRHAPHDAELLVFDATDQLSRVGVSSP